MKHIVKFSRGVTSAVMAEIVVKRYGKLDTLLVTHDTLEEHEDTYRFGDDVAAYLGMPIIEISDGRSVTQVFRDEGMLGNNTMTPCSRILKQEIGDRFIKTIIDSGDDAAVYVGMTEDEKRRLPGQREAYRKLGAEVYFPLIEAGLDKDACKQIVIECWGLRLPSTYEHFDHANCLATGCVKGGLAYWGLMYLYNRSGWEQRAALEDEFQQTILKYTRYGKYPEGSLRNMLSRCIAEARRWEKNRAQGKMLPLMNAPCVCAL